MAEILEKSSNLKIKESTTGSSDTGNKNDAPKTEPSATAIQGKESKSTVSEKVLKISESTDLKPKLPQDEGEESDAVSDEDAARADPLSEDEATDRLGDTDVSMGTGTEADSTDEMSGVDMNSERDKLLTNLLGNNGAQNPMYSAMDMARLLTPGSMTDAPLVLSTKEFATEEDRLKEFENIYGKLKKMDANKNEAEHGDPPTPKNLYEALQSNFLKTMARSHLYRIVMAGTHNEDQEALIDWMKDLIEDINVHCYSEIITGVLVIYPNHYLHVIEGSEDTIIKFMKLAADQFEPTGLDWKLEFRPGKGVKVREPIIFNSVKTYVIGMFRIKHRGILSGWKAERAFQVSMSENEVPPGGFREKLFQFAKSCCTMGVALYKLTPLRYSPPKDPSGKDFEDARERFEEAKRRRAHSMSKIVPKTAFIDYILKKDENRKIQLRTLREHIDFFWQIPPIILSQQTDWPIPSRIAPYD